MRRMDDDEAALSEIVGALLLVVVVSSAAFGFGIFLHQQAKLTEAQRAAELERQRESLEVESVVPFASGGQWQDLTFRVASRHLHGSTIEGLRLNGNAVRQVVLDVGGTPTPVSFDPASPDFASIQVPARGQVSFLLDDVHLGTPFFTPPGPIPSTASLHLEVLTGLGNGFERVFEPPTAVILVDQGGSAASGFILDGSRSTAPGENGFLVTFEWSVVPGAGDPDQGTFLYAGRTVLATVVCNAGECPNTPPSQAYAIQLTVTDNFGMQGTATYSLLL